jgi:hypothetical protein
MEAGSVEVVDAALPSFEEGASRALNRKKRHASHLIRLKASFLASQFERRSVENSADMSHRR